MKKVTRKLTQIILSIGFTVILFQARWYFNKPVYEKVDLSPESVLNLSESVFGYQLKNGFNGKQIPAKSFYLKILKGYPDRSFYRRFRYGGFPHVERNWLKNSDQHERDASLSIDNIVDNHTYFSVITTIKYCYDKIENIEYQVRYDNGKSIVEQSDYSKDMLADILSTNKAYQRNKLRCTSIIR